MQKTRYKKKLNKNNLKINILVFFISCLFIYILLELFLFATGLSYVKDFYNSCQGQQDDILHHSNIPNARCFTKESKTKEWFNITININSLGLRDVEHSLKKDKEKFRILMLGDSFTAGGFVNLEDTIHKKIERKLNENGKSVEIINAGVGSYSPVLEYLYLKNEGLKYEPDMIILNLDMSDVYDDTYYSSISDYDENGEILKVTPSDIRLISFKEKKKPFITRLAIFIGKYSYSFNFIKDRLLKPLKIKNNLQIWNGSGDIKVDKLAIVRTNNQSIYEKEWNITKKHILKIKEIADNNNMSFILTSYPYGLQISTDEFRIGRKAGLFDPDQIYSTTPFDYLTDFSEENNITFINLLPNFIKAKQEKPEIKLYFDIDPHFTLNGVSIMSDGVYDYLIENKIKLKNE